MYLHVNVADYVVEKDLEYVYKELKKNSYYILISCGVFCGLVLYLLYLIFNA